MPKSSTDLLFKAFLRARSLLRINDSISLFIHGCVFFLIRLRFTGRKSSMIGVKSFSQVYNLSLGLSNKLIVFHGIFPTEFWKSSWFAFKSIFRVVISIFLIGHIIPIFLIGHNQRTEGRAVVTESGLKNSGWRKKLWRGCYQQINKKLRGNGWSCRYMTIYCRYMTIYSVKSDSLHSPIFISFVIRGRLYVPILQFAWATLINSAWFWISHIYIIQGIISSFKYY